MSSGTLGLLAISLSVRLTHSYCRLLNGVNVLRWNKNFLIWVTFHYLSNNKQDNKNVPDNYTVTTL